MTTTATKWIDAKGGKARALWLRVTLLASPATYGDGHNQWARVQYVLPGATARDADGDATTATRRRSTRRGAKRARCGCA